MHHDVRKLYDSTCLVVINSPIMRVSCCLFFLFLSLKTRRPRGKNNRELDHFLRDYSRRMVKKLFQNIFRKKKERDHKTMLFSFFWLYTPEPHKGKVAWGCFRYIFSCSIFTIAIGCSSHTVVYDTTRFCHASSFITK